MRMRSRSSLVLLAFVLLPAALDAQQGVIVARANDAATARPLPTVQVTVTGGGTQAGGVTGDAGRVAVQVPPGTYRVAFTVPGMQPRVVEGVQVAAGQTVDVTVSLEPSAVFEHEGFVVSASRNAEKVTDPPNTIHIVGERTVEERPASTPADYVIGAPGVDIIRQGIQSTNVVVRGFNNIFSGALHALTDNRIAGVPSLRVNLLHFIPSTDDDVARVEVVLGPGSALYGPNTANGVLHIISKSPLAEPGTTVSLAGGSRDVFKGMFRTSHLLGQGENFGVKLSGQFLRGTDWRFQDPFERQARERANADPERFRENLRREGFTAEQAATAFERVGIRDFGFQRFSGEARADWRVSDAATWIFQAGLTSADGLELTGIGAGQTENWIYTYYQTRFSWDRLFAQVYLNRSDAGDSFLVRRGLPLVDNSNLLVGQVQHGFGLGADMGDGSRRQDFTYGLDVFLTTPQTEGQINGQYEDDDEIDEVGGYLQSETALTGTLDLIAAARVDKSSILDDAVFSPRAALVWEAAPDQSLRATYNRAFSTPTTLNYFLDINGGLAGFEGNQLLGFFTRALGPGKDGLSFQRADGSFHGVRSPLAPDPSAMLPADPAALFPFLVGVAQALAQAGQIPPDVPDLLQQLGPAGLGLNSLSPVDGSQRRLSDTTIPDAPRLNESTTETFEIGYQGILDSRVALSGDVWYSRRKNFTSPLLVQTPLVTYNAADLQAKFEGAGVPAGDAAALAGALGGIPLAVVTSPDVVSETADIVATYRNFGELDLFGWDLGFKAFLTDQWSLEGSASWVDDDFFVIRDDEEVDDPGPLGEGDIDDVLSLNAPDFKGALALGYRNAGFTGEGRVRFTSEFPVNSADFVGMACLDGLPASETIRPCVESFTLMDLLLGYRIPERNAEVQLHVSNLFDEEYRSFVGVPEIGRFAMLQLKYTF